MQKLKNLGPLLSLRLAKAAPMRRCNLHFLGVKKRYSQNPRPVAAALSHARASTDVLIEPGTLFSVDRSTRVGSGSGALQIRAPSAGCHHCKQQLFDIGPSGGYNIETKSPRFKLLAVLGFNPVAATISTSQT